MQQPWEQGKGCTRETEFCLGTDAWCTGYFKRNYPTQKDCFTDREKRPEGLSEWHRPQIECAKYLEDCAGTEAVCGIIEDTDIRKSCFEGRKKGSFLAANSPDCPESSQTNDERCVGTAEWCKMPRQVEMYGSTDACLGFRAEGPGASPKLPWLQPDFVRCSSGYNEPCQGTESFCGNVQDKDQRRKCYEAREPQPFAVVYSAQCPEAKKPEVEVCVGTKAWCNTPESVERYGSSDACMKFRGPAPGLSKWYPKATDGCSGGEECQGTESICQFSVDPVLRHDCFATRATPPWLEQNPEACSSGNANEEPCIGTAAWCGTQYERNNYIDQHECFEYRGFKTRDFADSVSKGLTAKVEKGVFDAAVNVTKQAILFELLHNGGSVDSTKKVAAEAANQLFDKIEKDVIETAVEKGVGKATI